MSRKVTSVVVCILALFAVGAVAAVASASMSLPVFTGEPTKSEGSAGEGKFRVVGGASVSCVSGTGTATFNAGSKDLGPASFHFETCSQGGEPCNSLGDPAKTVLLTGEWHLVLLGSGTTHKWFLLLLLPSFGVHVECPAAPVKLLTVTGDVLATISQKAGSKTEFGETVKSVGGLGKEQEFSEFENDAGTGVHTELSTVQEGTGAAKLSTEESTNNSVKFNAATSISG